jgi:NADH:ubiquinone oxidoreductase subunit K
MIYLSLLLSFFIFFIGVIMYIFNGNKNLIYILIALEVLLLAIGLILLQISFVIDDAVGSLLTLIILPLAGAESAFGLALLINFYPNKGNLSITH